MWKYLMKLSCVKMCCGSYNYYMLSKLLGSLTKRYTAISIIIDIIAD